MKYQEQLKPFSNAELKVIDIVFCVDGAVSMKRNGILKGLGVNITEFVQKIANDLQIHLDIQVGFVFHGGKEEDDNRLKWGYLKIKPLTSDLLNFTTAVLKAAENASGSEITLPALDWCLDMEWRSKAHRVIVMFTDEAFKGCEAKQWQKSKLDELVQKTHDQKVKILYYGKKVLFLKI